HDMSVIDHADIPVNKSRSDFDLQAFDSVCNDYRTIVNKIVGLPHKSIIVYCSSIEQAQALYAISASLTPSTIITSQTKKKAREEAVAQTRDGRLRVIYNVGVLTVGF